MGYIIGIYALEDLFMIQFFKFIRIVMLFPENKGIKGRFIGFGKIEFQFTIALYQSRKWEDVGHA